MNQAMENQEEMKVTDRDRIANRFEALFKRLNGGERKAWDERLKTLDYDRCQLTIDKMDEELKSSLKNDEKPTLRDFLRFYDQMTVSKPKATQTLEACDYCRRTGHRKVIIGLNFSGETGYMIRIDKKKGKKYDVNPMVNFPCKCPLGQKIKDENEDYRKLDDKKHSYILNNCSYGHDEQDLINEAIAYFNNKLRS